jgi:hypothetical protein
MNLEWQNSNTEIRKSEFKFRELNLDESQKMLNNPKYIVKCKSLEDLQKSYQNKIDGEFEAKKLVEIGKGLFNELRQKYNIETPVEFFIGNNTDNHQVLYIRVDKIDGQDLTKKENLQDINKIVQELYVNISRYYLDKLKNGEFFLTDINGSSQYVYGQKVDEVDKASQIYLVDADIYLDNRSESLLTTVYWLSRHLSSVEYKLRVDSSLPRENIKRFIDEYQTIFPNLDDKNTKRLSEIQRFLSGQGFGDEILPAIPTFEEK